MARRPEYGLEAHAPIDESLILSYGRRIMT